MSLRVRSTSSVKERRPKMSTTEAESALSRSTAAWKSCGERLMRAAAAASRGSMMRTVYWLKLPWPHMIR